MTEPVFCYFGTDNPVKVGDRILVHRIFFGRSRKATVTYVPGQSKRNREFGDDQWAFQIDGGYMYAGGYSPAQLPHTGKRIEFVSRPGEEAREAIRSLDIPPEEDAGETGRDFLAFLGCGTLVALMLAAIGALVAWVKSWF